MERINSPGGVTARYVPLGIGGDVQALRDQARTFWADIRRLALFRIDYQRDRG